MYASKSAAGAHGGKDGRQCAAVMTILMPANGVAAANDEAATISDGGRGLAVGSACTRAGSAFSPRLGAAC